MARKTLPPPHIFAIELLSTGVDVLKRDDFTGEVDVQPQARPKADYATLNAQRERKLVQEQAQLLEWLSRAANIPGLCTDSALPEPKPPTPQLAHNQVLLSNGLVMTMPRATNAIKRRL